MEFSRSYFQSTRNKYDLQTNTYLSLQSSHHESGGDELPRNFFDSLDQTNSHNSVTQSDCNAWVTQLTTNQSLLNTRRTRGQWKKVHGEHNIGASNALSEPDPLGIAVEEFDALPSSVPPERSKPNPKIGTDSVYCGGLTHYVASPPRNSRSDGYDWSTESKSSELGPSPLHISQRQLDAERGLSQLEDEKSVLMSIEDRIQPARSLTTIAVVHEALPASSKARSLEHGTSEPVSVSSSLHSSKLSGTSEVDAVSICVAPHGESDSQSKGDTHNVVTDDVMEMDPGFGLGNRRRVANYKQNEGYGRTTDATHEDIRLATKTVSSQCSLDGKEDQLPVVVDAATVENCRFYEAQMELYVGFIGIQAVFTYANFVFSNFAGGVLSLFGIIAASYSHLDRRVSSYILTATIYTVIVIVVSVAVSVGIEGLAAYKEDTLLKAISIGSIPLGVVFIFGNIYLAHQHWMLSRRLKVMVESSQSLAASVDHKKRSKREGRTTTVPRQMSRSHSHASRRASQRRRFSN